MRLPLLLLLRMRAWNSRMSCGIYIYILLVTRHPRGKWCMPCWLCDACMRVTNYTKYDMHFALLKINWMKKQKKKCTNERTSERAPFTRCPLHRMHSCVCESMISSAAAVVTAATSPAPKSHYSTLNASAPAAVHSNRREHCILVICNSIRMNLYWC